MLTFHFTGKHGEMTVCEKLTAGTVGKHVRITFSPEWDGLKKSAVFMALDGTIHTTCAVDVSGEVLIIPAEVLLHAEHKLYVQIQGFAADGAAVINSDRIPGPEIEPGVNPEELPALDVQNPVWYEVLSQMGDLSALKTSSNHSLVTAINELALRKPESGASAYEVAQENGFEGTEDQWLESLKGKNAYEYAVEKGYAGTEEDFAIDLSGRIFIVDLAIDDNEEYFANKTYYEIAHACASSKLVLLKYGIFITHILAGEPEEGCFLFEPLLHSVPDMPGYIVSINDHWHAAPITEESEDPVSGNFIVKLAYDESGEYVASASYNEIAQASENGKLVLLQYGIYVTHILAGKPDEDSFLFEPLLHSVPGIHGYIVDLEETWTDANPATEESTESETFICHEGETAFSEIQAAAATNKVCLCTGSDGQSYYPLLTFSVSGGAVFGAYNPSTNSARYVRVSQDDAWTAEERIEPDVFVGTESTTAIEFRKAFTSGRPCFLMKANAGEGIIMWVAYTCNSTNAKFYRLTPDGSIQHGVLDNGGTFSYETADTERKVFSGDESTTLAEYKAAYDSGKTCFLRRHNPSGVVTYIAHSITSSNAVFFTVNSTGAINYGYLSSDNTFTEQERTHTTVIGENSTNNQIPTAKAVFDSVKGKLDADKLTEATNTALAQAKASGEFDGAVGAAGPAGKNGGFYTPITTLSKDGRTMEITFHESDAAMPALPSVDIELPAGPQGPQGIAGVSQVPLFADSVDRCSDTDKVYVLPDGMIYAYMQAGTEPYANQIPASIGIDGKPYNGSKGYVNGYRLTSSGTEEAHTGFSVTGFMEASTGDTLRFQGLHSEDTSSNTSILFYDASFSHINPGTLIRGESAQALLTAGEYTIEDSFANCKYFRISSTNITDSSVVTVSKGEDEGTGYRWQNTGHAFIPADYEARILELESQASDLADMVAGLGSGVPDYVRQEAERVADLALEKQTAQSIVFAALSDIHYPYDDSSDGSATTSQAMLHTGMGISQIRQILPLDFVGLLGDYVAGGQDSTVAESKAALKFVRKAIYEATLGLPQIWLQGNHDRNPYDTDDGDLTEDELYSYIFAGNTGCVVDSDNPQRGYGYKDFEAQRIRVIYFNSSDISGAVNVSDFMFSAAQLRWMADTAFDLSTKADPSAWGIIILSHMPLNWSSTPLDLIDAYISGASGTVTATEGESVAYDFSGTHRGEIICCINGHTHNFRASRIGANNLWQIAVPQVCAGRYNEYGTSYPEVGGELDENGTPVYYIKAANSATSTSFNIFVIDRKTRKIHAICYGAGIDREISY